MSHSVPCVSHHAMLRSCADYDQYYASLAASEAPSTLPTPGLGEFGEEEDVKPNLEYLDSLNEYRKRSRSREDVGTGGSGWHSRRWVGRSRRAINARFNQLRRTRYGHKLGSGGMNVNCDKTIASQL